MDYTLQSPRTVRAITSTRNSNCGLTNSKGEDEIIAGPYFAPMDLILTDNYTLLNKIEEVCTMYKLDKDDFINWLICNNGFVDLRPDAILNTAKNFNDGLTDDIRILKTDQEFRKAINALKIKNAKNL